MEIKVHGRSTVPKHIQDFAHEKYSHLGRYLSTIETIDVELYEDGKPKDGKGHTANVTVATGGPVFRSKVASEDIRTSIEITVQRLERQVKEFKRRRSGRPAHSRPKGADADTLIEDEGSEPGAS